MERTRPGQYRQPRDCNGRPRLARSDPVGIRTGHHHCTLASEPALPRIKNSGRIRLGYYEGCGPVLLPDHIRNGAGIFGRAMSAVAESIRPNWAGPQWRWTGWRFPEMAARGPCSRDRLTCCAGRTASRWRRGRQCHSPSRSFGRHRRRAAGGCAGPLARNSAWPAAIQPDLASLLRATPAGSDVCRGDRFTRACVACGQTE